MNHHLNRSGLPLRQLLLGLIVAATASCTPGVGVEALHAEPVLTPPGEAAVGLGHADRRAERGLFLGPVSGYVRVIHASPRAPEEVVEWYLETHGPDYGFVTNDRYLSASGSGTATVLSATREDVRVSVRVDTAAPAGPDAPELLPPPEDTLTVVSVIVQSP